VKRLKYIGVTALLAAPVVVIPTVAPVHAAGGRLVSAGSVTLSGLAATGGVDGISNPETHGPEEDEGEHGGPPPSGRAPSVNPARVRAAGSEVALTFQGINHRDQRLARGGNQWSLEPPDQALCVGPTAVLEGVNDALRVYDKAGNPLTGVIALSEFYGYPPDINRTTGVYGEFITDPVCYYDPDSGRFFFAVLSIDQDPATGDRTGKNHLDIAVSASSDPTGTWNIYRLAVQDDGTDGTPNHHCDPAGAPPATMTNPAACFGDFPHIGADAYGIYITTNEYSFFGDGTHGGAAYTGAQIYAFSKSQLVAGASSPTVVQFESPALGPFRSFTVWPAVSPAGHEATSNGGTEFFLSSTLGDGSETGNTAPSENRIGVWAITNTSSIDSATPHLQLSNTLVRASKYVFPPAATQKAGPTPLLDCLNDSSDFFGPGLPCWALFFDPATTPQPVESVSRPDASDTRMNQVVYSDGRLYSAIGTGVRVSGSTRAGVLWFAVKPQIERGTLHEAEVTKSGYVGLKNNDITYPAIGLTSSGKIVMGATVTGEDHYPSASYTVLSDNNPTVRIISEGVGPDDGFTAYDSFVGPHRAARWGDYGAAVMDGDTLWLASESIEQSCTLDEYLTGSVGSCGGTRTALANWATRVSALNL
jgi:hypothetical protein